MNEYWRRIQAVYMKATKRRMTPDRADSNEILQYQIFPSTLIYLESSVLPRAYILVSLKQRNIFKLTIADLIVANVKVDRSRQQNSTLWYRKSDQTKDMSMISSSRYFVHIATAAGKHNFLWLFPQGLAAKVEIYTIQMTGHITNSNE